MGNEDNDKDVQRKEARDHGPHGRLERRTHGRVPCLNAWCAAGFRGLKRRLDEAHGASRQIWHRELQIPG